MPKPASDLERQSDFGLYLHVPFCLQKCPYCSFYSVPDRVDLHKRYIEAITEQIRQIADFQPVHEQQLTSIFFGGGTPTMLSSDSLSKLLTVCLHYFRSIDEAEISIEVNPATVDCAALQGLRQAGFNRLSIGAQSFNNQELRRLGRPHSAEDAVRTVQQARRSGFANINVDLMYGLPGQNLQSWQDTLAQALQLQPEHLSIYELTIEAGTPFARQREQGTLHLPDEDNVLLMLERMGRMVDRAGFLRYEISNYAQSGFQCRHNINYWRNGEYIGLGPGAVASLGGTRCTAMNDVSRYCELMEKGEEVWQAKETLEQEAAFRETVIMGLRMTAGVPLDDLRRRFGIDAAKYYGDILERLIRLGLLEIVQGRLRLTAQGLLLADTVMADLV